MSITLDHESLSPPPFTVASCQATLVRACDTLGLHHDDARLIRLGENAIFHLDREGLIARIARNRGKLSDASKELRVARWLIASDFDTAEPYDLDEPLMIDERPVTFWRYIEHDDTKATADQLGAVLRALHDLNPPDSLDLPRYKMFGRVDMRIDSFHQFPEADRAFLRERVQELREAYSQISFPLNECAIHGDAHVANLLRRVGGGVTLIDLESFAYGHPEADLAVTAGEKLMGWHTDEDYSGFVRAYGFDLFDWDGFSTIQAIGELKATTWLMQNLGHSASIDAEIYRRLDDLRHPERPRGWTPI